MRGRRRLRATVAAVVAAAASSLLAAAVPADAATCRVMQVNNAVPVGIALSPTHLDVAYGGCVQFVDNAFGPPVTINVGAHYSAKLNYSEHTSGAKNYTATTPGRQAVVADNGAAQAHGSITVGAAPKPSASPSPRPTTSSPAPSPQPTASPSPSATGPQVAPSPHRRGGGGLPVVGTTPPPSPGPGSSPPVLASSTPSPVAHVAGPLEPPGDRNIGLPASLAALVAVGVAAALVRVLLAEPVRAVDSRRSVGRPA